jgi:hypothetical protein
MLCKRVSNDLKLSRPVAFENFEQLTKNQLFFYLRNFFLSFRYPSNQLIHLVSV